MSGVQNKMQVEMNGRICTGVAAMAFSMVLTGTLASPQAPGEATHSPDWFLGSAPDPAGRAVVAPGGRVTSTGGGGGLMAPCSDDIAKYCTGQTPFGARACLMQNADKISGQCKAAVAALSAADPCNHSPNCANRLDGPRSGLQRVEWKQTMGYAYAYPVDLPEGGGGVSAVRVDSKGNMWVFQRNAAGKPQLFEFGPDRKLMRTVGEDVIGHQNKAHGMAIDADDNVWICDENSATVMKLSPDGKLLMTLGLRGRRGDWNEAKGQRLLWEPLDLAFAPNGDMYIGEGHGAESPNDADSDDPANNIGAARVIHLDKTGKFINQWYGNSLGPGKFSMVHGIAVDPKNGNVWLGDREEYRLVVYSANGKFVKTVQMRNLTCGVAFDLHGDLWVSSGQDGQLLKIDQNGNILGAVGNGPGTGQGQFSESNYMTWDKQGNLYTGDTGIGRVTEMVAPAK
jgi:sugar lactone lactonase YvrE